MRIKPLCTDLSQAMLLPRPINGLYFETTHTSLFDLQQQVYQHANAQAAKPQLRPGYKVFMLVTISQPILSSNLTKSLLFVCEESSTLLLKFGQIACLLSLLSALPEKVFKICASFYLAISTLLMCWGARKSWPGTMLS